MKIKTLIFLVLITVMGTSLAKEITFKANHDEKSFFIQSDSETMEVIGKVLDDAETFYREIDSYEIQASLKDDFKDEYRKRKDQAKDFYKKRKENAKEAYKNTKDYIKKVAVKLKNGAKIIFIDTPRKWIDKIVGYFESNEEMTQQE